MKILIFIGIFILALSLYFLSINYLSKKQWIREGKKTAIEEYNYTLTIPSPPNRARLEQVVCKSYAKYFLLGFEEGLEEIKKTIEI